MNASHKAGLQHLDYLRVDVTPVGPRRTRIVVAGELDRDTVPVLAGAFAGATGHDRVVELDLSGLTFVDAAGIRLLLHCHAVAHTVLLNPAGRVMRLLRILGMSDGLRVVYA